MPDLRPLCLALLPLMSATAQAPSVAFADHGRALLERLGEAAPPALPELLDRHYARLLLGDFDLRLPHGMLAKGDERDRAVAIAEAIVDLQERLDGYTVDRDALAASHAELRELRKYLSAWRRKPTATEAPDLPAHADPCVLIFAPTRTEFVGFVGWLGLWKPTYQDRWWFDGAAQFSDLRLEDEGQVQVVALEYASPKQNGDVTLGFDMNTRERTGLLQHVLQRAAVSWCWRTFGDGADEAFVLGLATVLVVDVLGENNARSGGSGKATATEGRNAFIPGAPSRGGSMEMVNADSAWRLSLGKDYFARVLRHGQKAGGHEAENDDKLGNFLLQDTKKEHRCVVTAPFLGAAAFERDEIAPAYVDDYLEFHRAYRAAFVHWLAVAGGKGKAQSAELFRTLLAKLAERVEGVTFEALCGEVYGVPLSAKASDADTLERRFLAWIKKS